MEVAHIENSCLIMIIVRIYHDHFRRMVLMLT